MALTRKLLKGMGLTEEQIDSVIDAHTETLDGLKTQIETYKADAAKLKDVQKELNDLKNGKDWKAEHDQLEKAFKDFKAEVAGKETLAAKQAAYRKLLSAENIPEKLHDKIIKLTDFSAIELDGDKIKDEGKQRESIKADWGDYVATTQTRGAHVDNPPKNDGGTLTKADIYAKDEKGRYKMSTAERQKALVEHPELMRKE